MQKEMETQPDRISVAWLALSDAMAAKYGKPLPKILMSIGNPDEGWGAQLNNTGKTIDGMDQFYGSASWGGFPAGIFGPDGGIIAAGSVANEEAFIEWLKGLPT